MKWPFVQQDVYLGQCEALFALLSVVQYLQIEKDIGTEPIIYGYVFNLVDLDVEESCVSFTVLKSSPVSSVVLKISWVASPA